MQLRRETDTCMKFATILELFIQACNQGGSRGSDEPPILTRFLFEPAIIYSYTAVKVSLYLEILEIAGLM